VSLFYNYLAVRGYSSVRGSIVDDKMQELRIEPYVFLGNRLQGSGKVQPRVRLSLIVESQPRGAAGMLRPAVASQHDVSWRI
jgi:hypothetical protein